MGRSMRILGIILGIIFLWWSFASVNWHIFYSSIISVNPALTALSAFSLFLAMIVRSMRWHVLTGLPFRDCRKVWEATCIGYLGNAIYPARAGDVMRMLRLQQLTGMSSGLAIGSSIIDRIFEGLGLCSLLLILLLFWKIGLEARQGLFAIAFLFLILAASAAAFVVRGHRMAVLFERSLFSGKWGVRLKRWYEECLAGLQALRSPIRLILAVTAQILVSVLDIFACWVLIQAFGWGLPFIAGVSVLMYVAAAASLPSSPGYVGVYQIAALFALKSYAIDGSSAVAFGTILQMITLILFVGVGLSAFLGKKRSNSNI
ncbi:MAG: flippase-like domain-containing protein [Glaciimonas sp.]|nr:flippase-like domain-containing protein [Glaciimonas sp.]